MRAGVGFAACDRPTTPPTHFATLSVPPNTVGTCLPVHVGTGLLASSGWKLVIASRLPSARREINVFTDARRRPRMLLDYTSFSIDDSSSASDAVVASVDSSGIVQGGMVTHTELRMPRPPMAARFDTSTLRDMRAHSTNRRTTSRLDSAGRLQARALVSAILARCGA